MSRKNYFVKAVNCPYKDSSQRIHVRQYSHGVSISFYIHQVTYSDGSTSEYVDYHVMYINPKQEELCCFVTRDFHSALARVEKIVDCLNLYGWHWPERHVYDVFYCG